MPYSPSEESLQESSINITGPADGGDDFAFDGDEEILSEGFDECAVIGDRDGVEEGLLE